MSDEMTQEEFVEYVNGLKPDERVIETGESGMNGREGYIYISENEMTKGSKCVRWDALPGEKGQMGTSVTYGTRRINEHKCRWCKHRWVNKHGKFCPSCARFQ